jgi:hypothetical protein
MYEPDPPSYQKRQTEGSDLSRRVVDFWSMRGSYR